MKREILKQFQGKENVTHVIIDNGTESYLSQSRCFGDEAYAIGATKLNTVENEKKHVLFLFNSNDEEVGRYYIGKALQGKTPKELIEIKQNLVFFESWNSESEKWIPCVGILNNNSLKDIASKAMSFNNPQTNKNDIADHTLSTKVTKEDLANAWTDEYGVMYSADKKRLLRITEDLISYSIRKGTQVICDKAFNWTEKESNAFSWNETLESVVFPDTVIRVGNGSFRNCVALSEVILSDELVEVGDYAFSGCKILTAINLPITLNIIGDAAFFGCEALSSINIPNLISRLGNSVFSECAFSQITIPQTVKEIDDYAFYCCSNLKKVRIPETVEKLGVGVFGGCPLLEFNIPRSLTELGFEFFLGSKFSQIIIPNWITKIGARAFYGSNLEQITIPDSVFLIGESAFEGCCLKEINIPYSVIEIADSTFMGCPLSNISIPNSIRKIGHIAFQLCQYLNNIVIPDSVAEMGNGVFRYCESLSSITFLGKVTQIGEEVFKGCDSLTQIIIPKGSKDHYEKLLPEYKNYFVEEGSSEKATHNNNSIEAILLASLWDDDDRSVKKTKHLLLLQHLLNNSMYMFKHPTDRSDRPSFMWNDEGLFMGSDSILPCTIPFLWIRTLAKRNVEKFNEVIDLLNKEFGVEVSEVIDVEDIVKGIRQYGFNDFNPNFDVHVNKPLLSTFYGDCLSLENYIHLFGLHIDMNTLLPSQSDKVNIPSASISLNNVINEMVDDFRKGQIEGN